MEEKMLYLRLFLGKKKNYAQLILLECIFVQRLQRTFKDCVTGFLTDRIVSFS